MEREVLEIKESILKELDTAIEELNKAKEILQNVSDDLIFDVAQEKANELDTIAKDI